MKIIEKVRKLLELAGNNPNENEAAAAIEKAHEILARHNLSMETVEGYQPEEKEDDERGMLNTETKYSEKYYKWLWSAVAEAHFCSMFSLRPNPKMRQTIYTVVGRRVNTVVATQLALYLCQTVKRLANEAALNADRTDHAYKNAFIAGCCLRLYHRVLDLKKKAPVGTTGNALIVLDNNEQKRNAAFIQAAGINLIQGRKRKASAMDSQGLYDGKQAAEKVSLHQQLNKGEAPKQLH
jgi:hypothetical protein